MKKQEIILTIGLPASGKTTWTLEYIQKHPDYVNINRDDIRLMLQGRARYSKFSKWREDAVSDIAIASARTALSHNKSIIISDTNLKIKYHTVWAELAKEFNIKLRLVKFTDVSLGECLARDKAREFPVGQQIIERMYKQHYDTWWKLPKIFNKEHFPNAYIVDIDGTLAEMNGRRPYDWDKVLDDLPKLDVIETVNLLSRDNIIIIVSGRDGIAEEDTKTWLKKHKVKYNSFFIRPKGDNRKDTIIKEEIYNNNIKHNFNVVGVFDDRDCVVATWRHLGLTCFQVNYGDF